MTVITIGQHDRLGPQIVVDQARLDADTIEVRRSAALGRRRYRGSKNPLHRRRLRRNRLHVSRRTRRRHRRAA